MLSRNIPTLSDLELLAEVARFGSMTAAATSFGLTQQSVSLRIRAAERVVGQPLLIRGQQGCRLTPAGNLVIEWSAPLLEDARRLAEGVASLRTQRDDRLRVAASLTIAEHLLPQWLLVLRERQTRRGRPVTDVGLRAVNSDGVISAVVAARADLGFIEGPQLPHGVRSRIVGVDDLVVAVHPEHPWARRRSPVSPGLLARTPLVRRESGSGSQQAFDDALAAALPPGTALAAAALEVSSPAAARIAAAAGLGPTAISRRAVADDLTLGRLVAVPTEGVDLRRRLRAIWIGDARRPTGVAQDLLAVATARSGG